jgi:potassium efflux system protein
VPPGARATANEVVRGVPTRMRFSVRAGAGLATGRDVAARKAVNGDPITASHEPRVTGHESETAIRPGHQTGVVVQRVHRPVFVILLFSASAAAALEGESGTASPAGFVVAGLTLLFAVAAHWGLLRLGRRLPRILARRNANGRPLPGGAELPWSRPIEVALLPFRIGVWLGAAWYLSEQLAPLRAFRHTSVRVLRMSLNAPLFTLAEKSYSALDLLALPAVLALLWLAASGFAYVFKAQVLRATGAERGVQDTVALLVRYTLMFIGTIVIFQAWGIDLRSLAIFASVLGVGIGFGLQNIANNFVSGVILNFERPVQPGDFINVGEWTGTVERIGGRSTEVRTLDNVTILIPNSRFLENEVINWTHRDPLSRIHVPAGVAYGSDIGKVRAVLLDVARRHPAVLADPKPRVEFRGFGDSSLNFELLVWTRDPRGQLRLKSDLNYQIDAGFRRYGVHIPFPQRDLHLRSPQLDRMLEAWSRRNFSAEELAAGDGHVPVDPAELPPDPGDEPARRSWSEADVERLVDGMRAHGGVPIATRRHLFSTYRQCFVGREAVDWIVAATGVSRDDAIGFGQLLIERGIIHHVLDEHSFKDGNYFYRFYADEREIRPTA